MSLPAVALATPKSITLGTGLASIIVTRMLAGLRSRWTMPFWCACCTAWQTGTKSSRRSLGVSFDLVAELAERQAVHQLHHEKRLAGGREAGVEDLGDVGVVHHRQGLAFLLETLQHRSRIHAGLDQLEGDLAPDGLGLLGDPDLAHAPFADFLLERVSTGDEHVR